MYALDKRTGSEKAALEQSSPNDPICVVWPTGEFFFLILLIFRYTKAVYSAYIPFTRLRGLRDGRIGENGPSVSFIFLYCFFLFM